MQVRKSSVFYLLVLELLHQNSNEPINGKILFQKLMFLLLKNYPKLFEEADFIPHRFGPYSESLESSLVELQELGLLSGEKENFKITDEGESELKKYEEYHLSDENKRKKLLEDIKSIKEQFNNFSSDEILAFIYKLEPEYIENSIKSDQLDYEELFITAYREGKLGLSKISELLNIPMIELKKKIRDKSKLEN